MSLLLDIERSLLVIDKKTAVKRETFKFKDKSRSVIRNNNSSKMKEEFLYLSPWIDHSTPPGEQLFF